MASAGHTSTQAMQSVQRPSSTAGRRTAGARAAVGQVTRHAPHAVQESPMRTVNPGTPGA